MQVEIWSDIVCPWCYLGKRRFENALAEFDHRDEVEVVYRSFELDPSAPAGSGVPTVEMLSTKYGMSVEKANDLQRQMEVRAEADDLTFRMDGLVSGNTRDAHRLLHLAKARNLQVELAEGLHRAYFTEQRSIFDSASLSTIAVEAGLDAGEVANVLAGDDYLADVVEDEETARALGANGVPFFVIDRKYGISGAQPADVIGEALQQAWADARS